MAKIGSQGHSKDKNIANDDEVDFAEYIRRHLKKINDETGQELKTRKIAEELEISYEMYRKILNQEKPTKKRDCVIAICIQNQFRYQYEIDTALNLYQYMPALDEGNERDRVIINEIFESNEKDIPLSIDSLNSRLLENNLPELDIYNKRDGHSEGRTKRKVHLKKYKVLKTRINTSTDNDIFHTDSNDSLCTRYSPLWIHCNGDMVIRDLKNKQKYLLSAYSSGELTLKTKSEDLNIKHFKNITETGEFEVYFFQLTQMVNEEKRRLLRIYNDTRNYQSRTSARVIEDSLCIFSEEFNYIIPELNEYYLLTYTKGQYELNVYEQSAFMKYYLSADKYKKYYSPIKKPKEKYESVEQIESMMALEEKSTNKYIILKLRISAFKKMKERVKELFERIKKRKEFIRNLSLLDDAQLDVREWYGLVKEFNGKYEHYENGDKLILQEESNFQLDDGQVIKITTEDLEQAYELGLDKIDDIIRIKLLYGSIIKLLE